MSITFVVVVGLLVVLTAVLLVEGLNQFIGEGNWWVYVAGAVVSLLTTTALCDYAGLAEAKETPLETQGEKCP